MAFVEIPVVTATTQLEDEAIDRLVAAMEAKFGEGWAAANAGLLAIAIGAVAPMASNAALNAGIVLPAVFRKYGTKLMQLPYNEGEAATATTIWTIVPSEVDRPAGIPAGTAVSIGNLAFYVQTDTDVPAKATHVTLTVIAAERGAGYNNQTGVAEQENPIDFVTEVKIEGESSGGADQEDDEEYEERLTAENELTTRSPITAADFAKKAKNAPSSILPTGVVVGRATALDGYNPETKAFGNENCVCVFVTDAQGAELTAEAMTALREWLKSFRLLNYEVFVEPPSYNPIFVTYKVHPLPGYSGTALIESIDQLLLNYLNPGLWGNPSFAASGGKLSPWYNEEQGFNIVRYNKVLGAIESVLGADYVFPGGEGLKIGTAPAPAGTVDLVLTGPAPLPTSNLTTPTIVGTVG